MPTLRNITCQVLWPEKTPFKEVATTYGDGIVETYIPIPSKKPQKFSIRVRSKGFIWEGLAVVVFVDGVYQLNRNRVNLTRPKKGQPAKQTEIDFMLRQEEKQLETKEYFLGSDWRFDNFRTDSAAADTGDEYFEGLGTIDVIVMRCCPRPDNVSPNDYDEGAESDVLGNTLTEDDFAGPQAQKSAESKGGKVAEIAEKLAAKLGKPDGPGKPENTGKGGKPGNNKDAASGTAKNDKGANGKDAKPAPTNKDKSKPAKASNDDDDDEDPDKDKDKQKQQQKQQRQKPKAKSGANSDDDDESDADKSKGKGKQQQKPKAKPQPATIADSDDGSEGDNIPGFDGPADDFYGRDCLYHDAYVPGRFQGDRYGYHGPSANGPAHLQSYPKHVHWDMGPGYAAHNDTRYSDRGNTPHVRSQYTPGLSQHPYHGHRPPYDYGSFPSHHQHQPPPSRGPGEAYYGNQGPPPPPPGYGPPHHRQPYGQGLAAGHAHMYAHQPVPQASYGGYPQQPPVDMGNSSQQIHHSNPNHQPLLQEGGGWRYVEPSTSVDNPATINKFNGWEYVNNTWVPAKDPQPNSQSSPANYTTNNNDNNAWGNGGQDNSAGNSDARPSWDNGGSSGPNNAGSDNAAQNDGNQNNDSGAWNQDNAQDTGGGVWGGSNDNANSSGNKTWGDESNNDNSDDKSSGNKDENGWAAEQNNADADTNDSKGGNKDRTLHGPLGAYHGPKIAVQPNENGAPWIADEPPCYDIPQSVAKKLGISKQVQRGKGYSYYKKHRKPIYIDSLSEPYARFVFKYRTRDKLPGGLDKEAGLEPTPDATIQSLQEKNKDDLIAELQKWRMAYGEEAPELKTKSGAAAKGRNKSKDNAPDDASWNLDLPKRDFLKYKLPGQLPLPSLGGEKAASDNSKNDGNEWSGGGGGWGNGDANTSNNTNNASGGWDTNATNSGTGGGGDNTWNTGGSGDDWKTQGTNGSGGNGQTPKSGW